MCRSASGPQATTSSTSSGLTMPAVCAKWPGIGSSCESSPSIATFGHSSCAVLTGSSFESGQQVVLADLRLPLAAILVVDLEVLRLRGDADEAVADAPG